MDSLEEYLTSSYLADRRDIETIESIIREVSGTLSRSDTPNGWPYELSSKGQYETPSSVSVSTSSMISLSLWKLIDCWDQPVSRGSSVKFPPVQIPDAAAMRKQLEKATETLLGAMSFGKDIVTLSGTYGDNDPITLSFLADICRVKEVSSLAGFDELDAYVRSSIEKLMAIDPSSEAEGFFKNVKNDVVENAILPLRIVRSAEGIETGLGDTQSVYRNYFEATLHQQLSFSAIPDSRFDPAELAFCLEGLLLVQRDACDETLFQRVLDVLAEAQTQSAFWRPVKPFMANSKGFSLFPVSVEVANSLIRSCSLFDGDKLHSTFGSACIPLFRRYWQWLRARTVRFDLGGNPVVGWHSEHINQSNAVHLWETSQVLEFLLNFRRALQMHIARSTLLLSRFSVREPKKDPKTDTWPEWPDLQLKFEPVKALGRNYEAYRLIGDDFVKGWRDGKPDRYSMLLYGPPGTGKTSIAENIADALGYRMITITVSDFLAGGGARLEARAKAIFDVLESQANAVVLFDEIDNFLLDRDSERYTKQDSVFQFMTPGMLTKLNDLRRSKRVLFVVATNYENRIDPAIKRTGRVDKKYLILPPDLAARSGILKEFEAKLPFAVADWEQLAKASLLLGYKDIEAAVLDNRSDPSADEVEFASKLSSRARTTSLRSFSARLGDVLDRDKPVQEFFALVILAMESGDSELDNPSVIAAIEQARGLANPSDALHGAEGELVKKLTQDA